MARTFPRRTASFSIREEGAVRQREKETITSPSTGSLGYLSHGDKTVRVSAFVPGIAERPSFPGNHGRWRTHAFASVECAINSLDSTCEYCDVRAIGYEIEATSRSFCCANLVIMALPRGRRQRLGTFDNLSALAIPSHLGTEAPASTHEAQNPQPPGLRFYALLADGGEPRVQLHRA